MDWVTVIWSTIAGACLMLAKIHLIVWCRNRRSWANFWFSITASGVAAMMVCEMIAMHTESPAIFEQCVRWVHAIYLFITLGILGFVHNYFGTGRRWVFVVALAMRMAAVVANFTTGSSLHFIAIDSLRKLIFLGEEISLPGKWQDNPWVRLGQLSSIFLLGYVMDASWRLWRIGTPDGRRRTIVLGMGLVLFIVLAASLPVLVMTGVLKIPLIASFPFLGMVLAMGYELSRDVLRAGSLLQQMKRSEQQLSLAAAAGNMSLWEWDIVANRIWVNGAGRMLYGVNPRDEINFARFVSTIHAPDQAGMKLAVQAALAGPEPYAADYRVNLPDGSIRWMAARGRVERDPEGRPCLLRGVSLDITERKESEERMRWVIEAAPTAMVMADPAGRIILINAQTEAVFGYTRDELLGKPIEILIPERFNRHHPGLRQGYHAHPTARAMGAGRELFGKRKDGSEVAVEIGLSPIQSSDGECVLASIIDISGRKQAEQEAARQFRELAHLSRISVLGELAGALAHELNQPLAAILSNSQVGSRSLGTSPDLAEMGAIFDDISADAKRAGGIIHGMRAMFKKDPPAAAPLVDMNEAVTQVIGLLHGEIVGRQVQVTALPAAGLPQVRAGRVQLQQVLINLVMNGLDAMREDPRQGPLWIATSRQDGTVTVTVHDSGPGIPPEIMTRLFDSFFSTKSGGLGLGLSISRNIVEHLGGSLLAENHRDGGAVFRMVLPAADA
ncbi:MAG: PAS domain S-box protein [Luteolibacter sp.]